MTDNIRDSYGADGSGEHAPQGTGPGSTNSGDDAAARTSTSTAPREPAPAGRRADVGGRSPRSSGGGAAGRADRAADRDDSAGSAGSAVRRIRDLLASALLTVTVLAAVVLALGAVLTALGANPENAIVSTVRDLGGRLDGPFADLFTFAGEPGKQLLVNWGIAALAYLVVGRVLERVLRP